MKKTLQQLMAVGMGLPGVRGAVRAAARGGLIPDRVWARVPVTGRFAIPVPGGRSLEYDIGFMDHLGRVLFYHGLDGWEPEILHVLPRLAAGATGVLDVGAHTGLFALMALAASESAVGIAAEPVLGNAALVGRNLVANRMDGRCMVVVAAVSDAAGRVSFDRSDVEVPMVAHVEPAGGAFGHQVVSTTIDLLAGWLPRLDLVKIDVEGHEVEVLRGGLAALRRDTPHVVIECLPGSRVEDVMPELAAVGYRRFHLHPTAVVPVDRIAPADGDVSFNYLLTARPAVVGA